MKKSRIVFLIVLSCCIVSSAWAAGKHKRPGMWKDQIVLQLAAESWVETQSARVEVTVDATLNTQGVAEFRKQIEHDLQKIIKTENWHITRFDQRAAKSGLEQIMVRAEARVPTSQLGDIRPNAKKISKPGVTYDVANMDFTPDLADQEKSRAQLREKIYQQAKAELARLQAVYPERRYRVHKIDFVLAQVPPRGMQAQRDFAMVKAAAPLPSLTISEKLRMQAAVVLVTDRPHKDDGQDQGKDD